MYPYCKLCSIAKAQNYVQENKEDTVKYFKKYYQQRKDHKDNLHRIWLENNKEYFKDYYREYQKNNSEKMRYYSNKRNNKNHKISKDEWIDCKKYFNNSCAYCGLSEQQHRKIYKQDLHKEHVIDCGRNNLKNCIPSCRICNSMKHLSSLNDWYNNNNPLYTFERYHKIYTWIRYDCKKYMKVKKLKVKILI